MCRIISLFIFVFVSISIFANSYDSDPRLEPDIVPYTITLFGDTSVSEQTRLHYLPQQIKGICGVKFGTEENEACAFLRNKFRSSGDWLNGQTLRFEKIKYGGTSFDSVNFLFQSDGLKSVLNGCIFTLVAKNRTAVAECLQRLRFILRKKYDLYKVRDEFGFIIFSGGLSPFWDGSFEALINDNVDIHNGFHTDVIEIDADIRKYAGYKYVVRLIYGPYNYVVEEF